ncbi:hypothetical protein NQ317_011633 [Molorchus minor]|uniref:Uncharacterized protein n=1 Tax=Molorchus minor TaxID=1323400 RepID=A0ABQ9JD08_9CUCU|nr:hypothetical protein NQ317_011633 [Molorchus minor]
MASGGAVGWHMTRCWIETDFGHFSDTPFGQVKVGELGGWLSRRNKRPSALVGAVSRRTPQELQIPLNFQHIAIVVQHQKFIT